MSSSSSYRQILRSSTNFPSNSQGHQQQKSPARPVGLVSPDSTIQPKQPPEPAAPPEDDGPAAPPAPPRSAFMCFCDAKKKTIMEERGIVDENEDILNTVAEEWKNLSDKDRAQWDEEARNDKVRYVRAKAAYKGPSLIPKRRAKKHPMAPKRPMSAFLKFSQRRRQRVKKENPDMSNTDVSRLLGEMWRNATPKEKEPYREQELQERAIYKENIKKFKEEQARQDAASRTSHQSVHGGYRHHGYAHPGQEYHQQRQYSSPHPVANTFDTLRVDSFEEPIPSSTSSKPGPFRSPYSHSYPPYRHTYGSGPEPLSVHHESGEFHDDPLQRAPLSAVEDEDSIAAHYNGSRSNYFHDNSTAGYFSRYG